MYMIILFFFAKEEKQHRHASKTTALNTKLQTGTLCNVQTTQNRQFGDLPTEHCFFTVNLRNGKIGRKCQIRQYALVSPTTSAAQCSTCYTATCCGLDRPNLVRSYKAKVQISASAVGCKIRARRTLPPPFHSLPFPFILPLLSFLSPPLPLLRSRPFKSS